MENGMSWEKLDDNFYENGRFSVCRPENSSWWFVSLVGKPDGITQDIRDVLHFAYDSAEEAMEDLDKACSLE
jgi:hypothetical protein